MTPTTGDIHLDDWKINDLPASSIHLLRRRVGVVFQDFKLLTDRTVYENVALALEILGKDEHEISRDVNKVLDIVGLAKKKFLFPQQLSAGEMQRTSIARTIVGGPKVLLADEPTGNLDPETSWEILDILQEINDIGTTIVMATHNASIVNYLKNVRSLSSMVQLSVTKHEEDTIFTKKPRGGSNHDRVCYCLQTHASLALSGGSGDTHDVFDTPFGGALFLGQYRILFCSEIF